MKRIFLFMGLLLLILSSCVPSQQIAPDLEHIPETVQVSLPQSSLSKERLAAFANNAVSGGPPKDGIPAIDNPQFTSAAEADKWLDNNDIVFGVVQDGIIKSYPQQILVWHEIVNDQFAGEKVSVTYCPLTGTSIGFKRMFNGTETTLGVSGKLVNNNLIMYDRLTDSYWPQILGTAVKGPLLGSRLEEFPLVWTTWGRWRQKYPETLVLSRNTGHIRNYDRDPYGNYNPLKGYYVRESTIFPNMAEDDRYPPKTVVIGARLNGEALAVLKDTMREEKIIDTRLGDMPIRILYDEELDTARFFKRDFATGEQLEQINAFDAMWFAWVAFYPDTEVYGG